MCVTKRYINKKELCKVTFILPARLAKGAISAHIAGEFNGWDPTSTRMKLVSGKFIRSIKLPANRDYQFRYIINGKVWENDLEADAIRHNPDINSFNSVINL